MKRILLALLFCCSVYAEPIFINDFSLGLDTRNRGFTGKYGYGDVVHNFNLRDNPGDLTVRLGYDSVFSIPGIDSFLWNGLHAINYLDGSKNLALVGDSIGVGYANVYITDDNSIDFGTIDSFFVYPRDTITNTSNDSAKFWTKLRIRVGAVDWISTLRLDTSLIDNASNIIDSMVVAVNASTVAPYVTASNHNDTLLIVEDAVDIDVDIYYKLGDYYVNPFGSPWPGYHFWDVARESGYLTPKDRIHTRFPATGQLWWSQFKGVTYLGTGTGKAISYDGKTVNTFPMRAPGEPNIIPLTTAGKLNGRYRYAFKYTSPVDSVADTAKYATFSYLSQPIIVDSGQVMLWDFPLPTRDYYYEGEDTVSIEVWRSVGDISRLDKGDSVFYTGITISFADSAGYADSVVVDTMSDSLIRLNSGQVYADGDFYSWQSGTIDTTTHRVYSKPGAPSIVSWGQANGSNLGIWGNGLTNSDTVSFGEAAGYAYMCTYVDTTQKSPSDSSRSFNFYQGSGIYNPTGLLSSFSYHDSTFLVINGDTVDYGFSRVGTEKITISLPRVNEKVRIKLYRGIIIPATLDSIRTSTNFEAYVITSDSFVCPYYYLIGEFNPGDTVIDSLCYDSLLAREIYDRNDVPPIIKQMVSYENQLIATDGKYIYDSEPSLDSVAYNVFNRLPIDIDDGDEITTIIPQFGVLKVLKNNSSFILKQNSEGYWRDFEASKNYGSVTGFSWIPAPEGDYFLSRDGVRLENENIYRENATIGSLMSNQLRNFTNMPITTQKLCFGTYIDGLAVFSFPSLDTSYVLNKIPMENGQYRYAWSTWSKIVPCGATKYDVRSDNLIVPADTTYFIKSGSNGVYRYGTQNTDNGVDIKYLWRSQQLTGMFDGYKQITNTYLELSSTDTVEEANYFTYTTERDTTVSDLTIALPRLDTSLTYMYAMPTARVSRSWKFVLTKNPNSNGVGNTIFRNVYIDLQKRGSLPTR